MGRYLDHDGRTDSTAYHFVLFVVFLAIFVGVLAARSSLPDPTAFVLVVASFMAVVWQGIYLGATFDADVRKVRPFPTKRVRAPKGTVTTDWVEFINAAERIKAELDRLESRPDNSTTGSDADR